MFWIALFLIGSAIALWRFTQNHSDDVYRFLGSLLALVCLIAGLAITPIFLRGIILLGLLVSPACFSQLELQQEHTCSRLCLFRGQCTPSFPGQNLPPRR